jgi:hypothetical protein
MASGDSYSVSCVTDWSSYGRLEVEQRAELLEAAVQVEATHGKEVCSYYIGQLLKAPLHQRLDAATITVAMLVVVKASVCSCVLQQLKQAGAAAHADVLLSAALAGVKARNTYGVSCLLDLDRAGSEAANRISAKGIFALLQAALATGPDIFKSLWQLSAVAELTGEELTVLLRCATKFGRWEAVQHQIQQHKAWASIAEEDRLGQLLQLSVQQGSD